MKTVEDLEKLVFDFNIDIGVNRLDGVVGCVEFFSDIKGLARDLDHLVDLYSDIAKYDEINHSLYEKSLQTIRHEMVIRHGSKKAEILMCYLGFITQVIVGLEDCPQFSNWIMNAHFSAQPHIFTHLVLVKCLQKSISLGNDSVARIIGGACEKEESKHSQFRDKDVSKSLLKDFDYSQIVIIALIILAFLSMIIYSVV